ncbi:hypothetical protein [Helicobacter salomonis]|uniref:hypothetical protein n=1 Tax=Helicobacter salomonis TaxID=56878 RepID=UPI000CF11788|nr:hypothetical protein [Helicobacter salomonis]
MKHIFKYDFLDSYTPIVGTHVFLLICTLLVSKDWLALDFLGEMLFFFGSGILVVCLIVALLRSLSETLFGKQAYLTWSLPLSVDQILLPKLMINLFWIVLSLFFLLLALALSYALNHSHEFFHALLSSLYKNCTQFGKHALTLLFFFALLYLKFLLVLSLLHAFKLKRLRKLIGLALFVLISVFLDLPSRWLYQFYQHTLDYGYIEFYLKLPFLEKHAIVVFWLLESCKIIGLYLTIRWLLLRHLNLE